jgi:chromosomal replication initiation ATPase DnaA
MTVVRQLALDLPNREALGRDDFLVSEANRQAVALIDAWPDWPHREALLIGPEGSGKSHLVEVWRARSGAGRITAAELSDAALPALGEAGGLAIEDCGPGLDQTTLVHLLNEMSRRQADVLLTARASPVHWGITLADLSSRLNRMAGAALAPPDDALMEAVLVKLFADRQLDVSPTVIRYLTTRLERGFADMRAAVARLDRMAIEEQRRVTRALAARMLTERAAPHD